jgi:Nickel responsive protein SCO4226-like
MPRFIIERVVPGAGKMTADELKAMSTRSCNVINNIGPKIQWIHSYVTENKIYCIYIAPDEETVREHAKLGGFPANQIAVIGRMIDPTTAEM